MLRQTAELQISNIHHSAMSQLLTVFTRLLSGKFPSFPVGVASIRGGFREKLSDQKSSHCLKLNLGGLMSEKLTI